MVVPNIFRIYTDEEKVLDNLSIRISVEIKLIAFRVHLWNAHLTVRGK